jgi:hypothetical protein
MIPRELPTILTSAFGLFLLWYVLAFCFKGYILDEFREELFALRDELFNYVGSIGLSYDDERHTFLRNMINTMIRFSHKLTFLRLVLVQFSKQKYPARYKTDSVERWKRELESLPSDERDRLIQIHHRMMRAAVFQLVWRSPILLPVITLYKVGSTIDAAAFAPMRRLAYQNIRLGLQEQQAEEQSVKNSHHTLAAV